MKEVGPSIAITGWGMVTPLGVNAVQTWNAILAGQSITEHTPALLPETYNTDRVTHLALHAAEQALTQSRWEDATEAALIIGTSKGPIEDWLADGSTIAANATFGLAATSVQLAKALRISLSPILTLSAACASGLHALIRAAMLLERGEVRRAIVVAVESSLHPLFIGCFARLGVLVPQGVGCKPFDRNRKGFLISEAAVAVCLESTDSARGIQIERYAIGGAAGHLTSGDLTGNVLRRLLRQVIDGRRVDLFHAHGTATIAHDPVELAAIENEAINDDAIIFSHKGALGHSLGAAGLLSVALNCEMHLRGTVPGLCNLSDPLPTRRGILPCQTLQSRIARSIVAASGFGGATAVLSLMESS